MEAENLSALTSQTFVAGNQALAALSEVAVLLPVFLLIFTWRGFSQACVAKWMGDTTAEEEGFLTLNPVAHVDVMGLLLILGVFFIIAGFLSGAIPRTVLLMILIMTGVRWTIPIPIDDRRFKRFRLGGVLTTLAGPFGNFLLAFMAVGLLKLSLQAGLARYALITVMEILKNLIRIALFFGVVDLIPIPPFDGGKLLRYALPYNAQGFVDKLEQHSLIIMIVLFFAPVISDIFFGGLMIIAEVLRILMFKVFF